MGLSATAEQLGDTYTVSGPLGRGRGRRVAVATPRNLEGVVDRRPLCMRLGVHVRHAPALPPPAPLPPSGSSLPRLLSPSGSSPFPGSSSPRSPQLPCATPFPRALSLTPAPRPQVRLRLDAPRGMTLHWAVDDWLLPPQAAWPAGTVKVWAAGRRRGANAWDAGEVGDGVGWDGQIRHAHRV